MLESLTADAFRPHVGATYQVASETGDSVAMELATVDESGTRPDEGRTPFSLVFRGPGDTPLGQGTYRVERSGGDALDDIFLVPIGPDPAGDGVLYEAVFG